MLAGELYGPDVRLNTFALERNTSLYVAVSLGYVCKDLLKYTDRAYIHIGYIQ